MKNLEYDFQRDLEGLFSQYLDEKREKGKEGDK